MATEGVMTWIIKCKDGGYFKDYHVSPHWKKWAGVPFIIGDPVGERWRAQQFKDEEAALVVNAFLGDDWEVIDGKL